MLRSSVLNIAPGGGGELSGLPSNFARGVGGTRRAQQVCPTAEGGAVGDQTPGQVGLPGLPKGDAAPGFGVRCHAWRVGGRQAQCRAPARRE